MAFSPETYGLLKAQAGKANGFASLNNSSKVPEEQLPSYVDDVVEYSARSAFPTTGEEGKIYVALDTGLVYRWSGSTYVQIGGVGNINVGSIAFSSTWAGNNPYTQTVTVTGAEITPQSKIDLQPTASNVAQLLSTGIESLMIENNNGVLTAYAFEVAPAFSITLPCTVTEVTT